MSDPSKTAHFFCNFYCMFVGFQTTLMVVKIKAGPPLDFCKWWMAMGPSYAILVGIVMHVIIKYMERRKRSLDPLTYVSLCNEYANSDDSIPHDWFTPQEIPGEIDVVTSSWDSAIDIRPQLSDAI